MIKLIPFCLLIFFSLAVFGQESIPLGTWRTHYNYQSSFALEKVNDKIYCLTNQGLFYYDFLENSTSELSKINGLSDAEITAMAYNTELQVLSLGYKNGNIDLIFEDEIFNISTIKKSSITENKKINHISYYAGKVYFSTDFGVLVLNPENGEIEETYQNLGVNGTSLNIHQALFVSDNLFLATTSGVLQANLNSNLNLQDFNNWNRYEGTIIEGENIISIVAVNNSLFANTSSTIFELTDNSWTDIVLNTSGESIHKLKKNTNNLLILQETAIIERTPIGAVSTLKIAIGDHPRDVIVGNEQTYWYADLNNGLSQYLNGEVKRISPNGVFSSIVTRLEYVNNSILAFPNSGQSNSTPFNTGLAYAQFEGGTWTNVEPTEILNKDDITDAVAIGENNLILSSFGHGVIDLSTGTLYNETNSPLMNNNNSGRNVLVTSMELDESGNVWISQIAQNSILKFTPDKNWESFDLNFTEARSPQNIKIDEYGQIWILPQQGFSGIIGFNPETNDVRYFTTANSELPNSSVLDLEIDKSGQLWVGTATGLAYLPFTFGVLEDNSIGFIEPVFENRVLFDEDRVNAIEVDAGNRKWIATNSGLWLFEDNGDELVINFNTENSPLPSNDIIDLKIDPVSGELFIATEKGLISYRSDAVEGNSFHQTVKIFPNPVPPNYSGQIGFSGLASDVTLKITDVSGKLVREINAAGGGASWNAADYNGVRVQTGVYLVFSSNDEGTETIVGKIAVVN